VKGDMQMAKMVREIVLKYKMRKITEAEENNGYLNRVSRPDEAVNAVKDLADEGIEKFVCLFLNAKNRILVKQLMNAGTVNKATPIIREIFRYAIACDATGLIMAHNHPTGNIEPSNEDKEYTKAIANAGEVLNISVLDHIIIGRNLDTGEIRHYSFACAGLLG
jgi:DNA repair protein RadC